MKNHCALTDTATRTRFAGYLQQQIVQLQQQCTEINAKRSKTSRKAWQAGRTLDYKTWQQIDRLKVVELFLVDLRVSDAIVEKVCDISCCYLSPVLKAIHCNHGSTLTELQKQQLHFLLEVQVTRDTRRIFNAFLKQENTLAA
ncbi:hypothetical protein BKE30_13445 [Alkanindiges hydrocarboniclasticus]|uniref:Uncharacterized protein n=1 Tax=Alkanindiges hydrocarboniclasticus TaxID=1907941 RepID=A0A1S8CTC7_9GAMM|nr:hypothetical protein [Alkanindiges hydrocarboniclasticus]ONG37950.1 hypothetical protein BKE30_13445 [Alkanindiges hydrocarboniclasticus]